jgi:glycosyltransferase involved in cell wall biosynthesis
MHLILFFTYDISLQTWKDTGLLQREIQLYKKLTEKGIKVSFITYGDRGDYQYEAELKEIEIVPFYSFVRRPKSRFFRLIQSVRLPWVLGDVLKQANIYKTNQIWGGWNAVIAKWLFRRPLIARCGYEHYSFSIRQKQPWYRRLLVYFVSSLVYKQADVICVSSEEDRSFIHDNFKINTDRIRLQKNWIDIESFKPLNLIEYPDRLLFVGRFNQQKNLLNLFKAFKGLPYFLDLVGDGEDMLKMKEYSRKNGVETRFLGNLPNDELPRIINKYPVFVLPSFFEGTPKVLLEAMACARAVIGTEVAGIRNIITHEENGYLCKTDSESIRSAIIHLMKDPEKRQKLGQSARKLIKDNFTLQRNQENEIVIYHEILNN